MDMIQKGNLRHRFARAAQVRSIVTTLSVVPLLFVLAAIPDVKASGEIVSGVVLLGGLFLASVLM